jgi:hypothetical protein
MPQDRGNERFLPLPHRLTRYKASRYDSEARVHAFTSIAITLSVQMFAFTKERVVVGWLVVYLTTIFNN